MKTEGQHVEAVKRKAAKNEKSDEVGESTTSSHITHLVINEND